MYITSVSSGPCTYMLIMQQYHAATMVTTLTKLQIFISLCIMYKCVTYKTTDNIII